MSEPEPKPTVSLVLGSGGARGLCHIGVIRCLQERGYDIRYVAGSSIGALVGGIHAAGKLDAYVDWLSALQKIDVVRLLDWSFDGKALFKGDRIIKVLQDLVGDHLIEDLPVRYTAVATDLSGSGASREVWFNEGPLFPAIRASMAAPTVFEPVVMGSRLLVDGGVINPVPVAPTLNDRSDLTIAVDLNASHRNGAARLDPPAADSTADEPNMASRLLASALPSNVSASLSASLTPLQSAYRERITQFVERLVPQSDNDKPDSDGVGRGASLKFSDVAIRSIEAMQSSITQFRLAATPAGVLIAIPHDLCSFFEFHRASELIEYGYRATDRALDRYRGDTG